MEFEKIHSIAKNKRNQIEMSVKRSQYELINKIAQNRKISVLIAARDLLKEGLEKFDEESRKISPIKLLANYEKKYEECENSESITLNINFERKFIIKIRLRSGEYEYSFPLFANLILNNALFNNQKF